MILETASIVLKQGYVCDHCLGRQFGLLLSGHSNEERGRWIRNALAMEYEKKAIDVDTSNFYGYKFRFGKMKPKKPGKCSICLGFFGDLERTAGKIMKRLQTLDFRTFVVGVTLSDRLVMIEEALWEKTGSAAAEPIRAEINREIGKILEKRTGKEADELKPDVQVLLNLQTDRISISVNPLFVYGLYNKYKRGLPQTKWARYKETVEDIIAGPFMKTTGGLSHAMHAAGREDRDARCLGWRPFVLEIKNPRKRSVDLTKMRKAVNKTGKVKVKDLRLSDKKEVIEIKALRLDKVYRATVKFAEPVKNIGKLRKLAGKIQQKTPKRVLHRRADKLRVRRVKNIKWKRINNTTYRMDIHTDAGLYVKELVSGDSGRTSPSVSSMLGNMAEVKDLDVIEIEKWKHGKKKQGS